MLSEAIKLMTQNLLSLIRVLTTISLLSKSISPLIAQHVQSKPQHPVSGGGYHNGHFPHGGHGLGDADFWGLSFFAFIWFLFFVLPGLIKIIKGWNYNRKWAKKQKPPVN